MGAGLGHPRERGRHVLRADLQQLHPRRRAGGPVANRPGSSALEVHNLRHGGETMTSDNAREAAPEGPAEPGRDSWWIATDSLARGGEKILGPFGSRNLAIEVRVFVE